MFRLDWHLNSSKVGIDQTDVETPRRTLPKLIETELVHGTSQILHPYWNQILPIEDGVYFSTEAE